MRARELRILSCTAALALACALSACASNGGVAPSPELLASQPSPLKSASAPIDAPTDVADLPDGASEISDPFEKMNRSVFEGNQRFNHAVVYPAARAYHETVPEPVRNSVRISQSNLGEPMVFANDVLQLRLGCRGDDRRSLRHELDHRRRRFVRRREQEKLEPQTGDFGQTLYVWGMRKSDYLVVPIIGPTNVRDLIGTTVDFVATIPAGSFLQTGLAASQFATQAANDGQRADRCRIDRNPIHQA